MVGVEFGGSSSSSGDSSRLKAEKGITAVSTLQWAAAAHVASEPF